MGSFSRQRPPGTGFPSEEAIDKAFEDLAKRDILRLEGEREVASEGFWSLAAMLRDEQRINDALAGGAEKRAANKRAGKKTSKSKK